METNGTSFYRALRWLRDYGILFLTGMLITISVQLCQHQNHITNVIEPKVASNTLQTDTNGVNIESNGKKLDSLAKKVDSLTYELKQFKKFKRIK